MTEKYGRGELTGRYRNTIFFVYNEKICYSSMDDLLVTEQFLHVSKSHNKSVEEFPLDSLFKDIIHKKYCYDVEKKQVNSLILGDGFKTFFSNVLKNIE